MARAARRYSAKLKFQVVLEALKGEKTPAQIAKAYGVHATSIGLWKQTFLKRGYLVFDAVEGDGDEARKIADLERLLGKKEVEIALLKNFLGRSE
jgi:transposase